jgi:DNA helicase-2/ATP-dependent DNA helicase PcrA
MTDANYLDSLNPEQRQATDHGIGTKNQQPLLIIAGAGSGKTNTLAHRVAHLVVIGADPRRLLLMTFSRRAAVEMARRVERIVTNAFKSNTGMGSAALTWAGTFHSIGARLLREHAHQIGLDPSFTIHDRADSADLMNLMRHDLGLSTTKARFPTKGTCLAIYSRVVNAQEELERVLSRAFPWCCDWEAELRKLFAAYTDAKQQQNVLDYDDLLLYWAQVMREPAIAADIRSRFDHVLVDEYQDTNRLQAEILLALRPDGRGLTVVGDDAQSIYSFRAATVRNILEFPGKFCPPARVMTLERNYRSTQPILAASNAVIALAEEGFGKKLWSDRASGALPRLVTVRDDSDQVLYVVERVLENREAGIALKAQAVLFRASHHSAALEVELTVRKIPFVKFGGLKFLDSAHVKDVLACLRWAENPRDRVAGFRVLQLLPGVGPTAAGGILDETDRVVSALTDIAPPPRTGVEWRSFTGLMERLSRRTAGWPSELSDIRHWYQPLLERIYEDAALRAVDLVQLEHIATNYPSRERFLTELTLDPPNATSGEAGIPLKDDDYLILSTIHSAKGLEWKAVYVLNAVDGCIPSDLATETTDEVEEERRLLYVAMTRAKDQLDIIVPQRFYVHQQPGRGDRHVYTGRTRFIPDSILPLFEVQTWPGAAFAGPQKRQLSPERQIDIGARMRALWR